MDRIFDSVNVRGGVNFPVLPTTYCDELSYLEVQSKLIKLVNELIDGCNLNTEEVSKIYGQWNEIIKDVDSSKTIIERLELLIAQGDLQESTHDDIDKMFDNSQTPTTPDGLGYASDTDIDNLF